GVGGRPAAAERWAGEGGAGAPAAVAARRVAARERGPGAGRRARRWGLARASDTCSLVERGATRRQSKRQEQRGGGRMRKPAPRQGVLSTTGSGVGGVAGPETRRPRGQFRRSEERRVGKERGSRWRREAQAKGAGSDT